MAIIPEKQTDNLNGFRTHGIVFTRNAGNQAVADCPFCNKEGHFYANKETRLWDCKRCGETGNFEDFLGAVARSHAENLSEDRLGELARDRGLPVSAFRAFPIGFDGNRYSVPVANSKGRVIDVRLFRLGHKLLSTPTASTGLFNVQDLVLPKNHQKKVCICEGEWDAIAWKWLVEDLGKDYVVVGVPGANTFKGIWIPFFQDRHVDVLYDNDAAGENGELTVRAKLEGTVKSLRFLHWGSAFSIGYDIRDLVRDLAVKRKDPARAFDAVQRLLQPLPRLVQVPSEGDRAPSGKNGEAPIPSSVRQAEEVLEPISTEELITEYKKWLHLASTDSLKVMYGVMMANKLEGDPIWLFLVAPPGGSKSELLMSISKSGTTHAISSLTPHTLISGANWKEGQDPSLLPQLKDKVLIIKDFTTLLTMHYSVRDEIFGTLRDIYDGHTEKAFGNGVRRKYNVHFGILAGVTPAIETFNVVHQGLGERFLKFRISGNWDTNSEEDKILRALNNIGREDRMRSELQKAGSRWLAHAKLPPEIPLLSDEMKGRLVHLAKFSARLRGVVDRDKYSGQVLYKPSSEVGTRIAKQLAKLGTGIAMFLGKKKVDEEIYSLIRRVALDTVPDRVEDIVRALWLATWESPGRSCKTVDVVGRTRLPSTTVFRVLQDMNLLRLVENRAGGKGQAEWAVSDKIREHIEKARVYQQEEVKTKTSPSRKGLTIRR